MHIVLGMRDVEIIRNEQQQNKEGGMIRVQSCRGCVHGDVYAVYEMAFVDCLKKSIIKAEVYKSDSKLVSRAVSALGCKRYEKGDV